RLYRITPAGERALRRWLEERPEHEPFKSEFLLKLFFGHQMSRERLLALVEGHRRDSQEALERLREIGAQIDGDPRFRSARLTLEYGIAHFRERELVRPGPEDAERRGRVIGSDE